MSAGLVVRSKPNLIVDTSRASRLDPKPVLGSTRDPLDAPGSSDSLHLYRWLRTEQIERARKDGAHVCEDRPLSLVRRNIPRPIQPGAREPTARSNAVAEAHGAAELNRQGVFGSGVRVAVIGPGMEDLADFQDRLTRHNVDLRTSDAHPDPDGLGTCLGTLIAGRGNLPGIAPNARLESITTIDEHGRSSVSLLIAGLRKAHELQEQTDEPMIVLATLGGDLGPDELEMVQPWLDKLRWAGAAVVVPVGDDGPRRGTVQGLAKARGVMVVGPLETGLTPEADDDRFAQYGSRGGDRDTLGPVFGAEATAWLTLPNASHAETSGSVVSAATAAGLLALFFERARALYGQGAPAKLVASGKWIDIFRSSVVRDDNQVDERDCVGSLRVDLAVKGLPEAFPLDHPRTVGTVRARSLANAPADRDRGEAAALAAVDSYLSALGAEAHSLLDPGVASPRGAPSLVRLDAPEEASALIELAMNQRARDILRLNDMGGFTVPTHGMYPYQWNWDSALVALGLATFDMDRAIQEVETLFDAQWPEGMVPHIVFRHDDSRYFPGPSVWQTGRSPESSGITQPPVAASVVLQLWHQAQTPEQQARIKALFPKLLASHQWFHRVRDPDGRGVVLITHPWESGRDNSAEWYEAMARVDVSRVGPYTRRDLDHADAEMRPTKAQYDAYIALVENGRDWGWDQERLAREGPFRVADVGMSMILLRADRDLAQLAEALGEPADTQREIASWIEHGKQGMDFLWDDQTKTFCSRDLFDGRPSGLVTNASFLAFHAGIDNDAQAAAMLEHWDRIAAKVPYMVPSLDPYHPLFKPKRYWLGPLWAVVNKMISDGMRDAGHADRAERIRQNTRALIKKFGFCEAFSPLGDGGSGGNDFSWTAAMWLAWRDTART